MPYFGIFGLDFQTTIVLFDISFVEFVKYEFLTHTGNFVKGVRFF